MRELFNILMHDSVTVNEIGMTDACVQSGPIVLILVYVYVIRCLQTYSNRKRQVFSCKYQRDRSRFRVR